MGLLAFGLAGQAGIVQAADASDNMSGKTTTSVEIQPGTLSLSDVPATIDLTDATTPPTVASILTKNYDFTQTFAAAKVTDNRGLVAAGGTSSNSTWNLDVTASEWAADTTGNDFGVAFLKTNGLLSFANGSGSAGAGSLYTTSGQQGETAVPDSAENSQVKLTINQGIAGSGTYQKTLTWTLSSAVAGN